VKELVADGAIGALRFVRGSFSFPLTSSNDFRLDPAMGGGCLWDVGCYPLSFTRFVLGKEPLEVSGAWTLGPTGIDETFAGQLWFADGVLAQIDAGFRSALRAEVELVGAEGTIRVRSPWRPLEGEPILLTRGDETTPMVVEGPDRYRLEIEDLADAVIDGRPTRVSLAESRGNVATIAALLQSAREGRPVRL
jgi:xylose dehydrogenase (NAD/NADP)